VVLISWGNPKGGVEGYTLWGEERNRGKGSKALKKTLRANTGKESEGEMVEEQPSGRRRLSPAVKNCVLSKDGQKGASEKYYGKPGCTDVEKRAGPTTLAGAVKKVLERRFQKRGNLKHRSKKKSDGKLQEEKAKRAKVEREVLCQEILMKRKRKERGPHGEGL